MVNALELVGKLLGGALGQIFKTLHVGPFQFWFELSKNLGHWGDNFDALGQKEIYDKLLDTDPCIKDLGSEEGFKRLSEWFMGISGIDLKIFCGSGGPSKVPKGPLPLIIGMFALGIAVSSLFGPFWERGYGETLAQHGARSAKATLLDANSLTRAYLRAEITDAQYDDTIDAMGFNEERKKVMQALRWEVAPISDVIRFVVKEVYDPERRKELLSIPVPEDAIKKAKLVGLNKELVDDYWAGHWVLPSIGQLNEMLHRNVINAETWDRFVRYNDYDPTMTGNLEKIIYNPLTRVDIRRIYDLRVIDEAQLLQGYKDIGYNQEKADTMTTWTKVYTEWPDLMARFRGGWLSEDEVKSSLVEIGMDEERAAVLIETKTKKDKEERTTGERDRTKAEIVKGVKLGKLTSVEAEELIVEMGYDEDEATYIVEVGTETTPKLALDRNITRTDILRSLNKGLIDRTESAKMLMDLYYDEWEANFIIDAWYDPAPPEEEELRQRKHLSKAEIIKGLKQAVITRDMAKSQLIDLGYEDWESEYIMYINVKPPEASPQTKDDYRNMIASYKKAIGKEAKKIPEAASKMLLEINAVKKELETAKKKINNDDEIQRLTDKLNDLENRYRKERKE